MVMVYHRNFWNAYIVAGLIHGIVRGQVFRGRSIHRIMQDTTDGAIARYYTRSEWKDLVSEFFEVVSVRIFGPKADIVPLPASRLKQAALGVIPDSLSRFLTNDCGIGSILVSTLRKPGPR